MRKVETLEVKASTLVKLLVVFSTIRSTKKRNRNKKEKVENMLLKKSTFKILKRLLSFVKKK